MVEWVWLFNIILMWERIICLSFRENLLLFRIEELSNRIRVTELSTFWIFITRPVQGLLFSLSQLIYFSSFPMIWKDIDWLTYMVIWSRKINWKIFLYIVKNSLFLIINKDYIDEMPNLILYIPLFTYLKIMEFSLK